MNIRLYLAACLFPLIASPASAQVRSLEMLKNESFVTYRLHHPLHNVEATSKDVDCKITADPSAREIKTVSAQVDVTTFDSGNSNRDSHAMEVIDALSYPEASFASTSVSQNGDSIKVSGKMTFHGVTKDIVIPAACRWSDGKLKVQGQFDLSLTEFKVQRPSLLLMPVDDALKFSFVAVFAL
jgi:polyisoprenoid-binding protein YceI